MKSIKLTLVLIFAAASSILAQYSGLKVETSSYNPLGAFPTIQSTQPNAMTINTGDTLRYFLNKHYYRNSLSGNPTPNTQYFTLSQPYSSNALVISHCGGVFLNASSITVTGLEGIVTRRANAVSQTIPLKLYLCNVNAMNMPILPPLDSVTAISTATNNGAWIGGNFTTPVNVSGNFAVLFRNAGNTPGDTLGLFINNACTPTSTCPAARKYGEGLGVMRINGNFQSNTNTFGTGTDYEFIVAPRVQFNYSSGIAVITPTVCLNGFGILNNATTPMNLVENRQFNFNKFAAVWGALSNTLLPITDSIYNWAFTGSPSGPLTTKDATPLFTANGTQTASLTVKYNKSRAAGLLPSIQDVSTATLLVSSANTPTVAMSGNTLICSGSSSTLTASGTATYNWGGPQFNNPVTVVSPTATTVYTCVANNGICLGYYHYTVNVTANPTLVITGPSKACLGGTVLLTVAGAATYSWSNGSTTYSTVVSGAALGVQVLTVSGVSAPCAPVNVVKSITVNALPVVSISAPVSTVCSMATGGSTVQLSGTPAGGQYSGIFVNNSIFTPNAVTTATMQYSYMDPVTQCSNSATTSISVLACQGTGVNENNLNNQLALFPNPSASGRIQISGLEGENTIYVFSVLGQLIGVENANTATYTVNLAGQSDGVYLIRLEHQQGAVRTLRCVVQKQ